MERIPFKTIGSCCAVMTILVVIRCIVSISRVLYYGGTMWLQVIQADPWLYVAVGTAAASVICFTMAIVQERLRDPDDCDDSPESQEK